MMNDIALHRINHSAGSIVIWLECNIPARRMNYSHMNLLISEHMSILGESLFIDAAANNRYILNGLDDE